MYDITDFLKQHPGGDKLLLAAGASVEPFWTIYAQHKADYVMEILESLRIGSLDSVEMSANSKQVTVVNNNSLKL